MANTKLRNIQFYRNGQVQEITNESNESVIGDKTYLINDLKSAYVYAEALFKHSEKHKNMLDGEILLYRFSYNGQVHTLVGVVHVSGTGTSAIHSLEVLANYDMLGAEISNEIAAAINALDGSATIASVSDGVVTLKSGIVQTDGIVANITDDEEIILAKVATTGAAADVNIADSGNLITATTVEGALAEIAAEIDAMDYAATDVVVLNEGKTALQAGKISETDGKIAVGTATNVVEFNQALSVTNKVATMADVTAAQNNATIAGQNAIEVANAPEGQTGKVVSLKINSNDTVLTQDASGLLANIKLTYDSTNKKIKLFGKEGTTAATASLGEIDATDFIKDGMLSGAELVTTAEQGVTDVEAPYIKLTFNTDAGAQVLRFSVKSLVDVYTSGNTDTLTISDNYTITPVTAEVAANAKGLAVAGDVYTKIAATKGQDIQTITGETAIENGSSFVSTAVTATKGQNDDNYTLSSTSTVKTQAVANAAADNDGLATALDVKTYVDAKVGSEYTADGELSMSTDRVITHNESGVITTEDGEVDSKTKGSVLTDVNTNIPTIKVPVITVNKYGHVTTLTETPYKVKYPTVSGESGQIVITTTAATDNAGTNYTVSLADVTQTNDDTATSSFADENNKFTFVKSVNVDAKGRVTGIVTETVTEDFDAGTY